MKCDSCEYRIWVRVERKFTEWEIVRVAMSVLEFFEEFTQIFYKVLLC